jgi:hypothetical protein
MSRTTAQAASAPAWIDLILGSGDPAEAWNAIFVRLRDLALTSANPAALPKETVAPDRLLAESAWDLWEAFPRCAPRVVDELQRFWVHATGAGTAVLILDGLSLRELPLIVQAGQSRGLSPDRVEVRGVEVPTETDRFAAALGLSGRAKLYNNEPPGTFMFAGSDVYTDVLDVPFADCVGAIPSKPRLFIWHTWPDKLVHDHEDKKDGPSAVASHTKSELASDGFWMLVDRLRQGRRLVITGDHGYATAGEFSQELKDEDTMKLMRSSFGASRCARESSAAPWPRRHVPPLVLRHDGWLVVVGQRKWAVQGGFPHLCHRGLTLLEATVPWIEYPAR